jgi:hypothetical protein
VLSPFVFWSTTTRNAQSTTLRIASAVVIVASLVVGVTALARDLRTAYLYAGPSIFSPVDQRQMGVVRALLPTGAPILLLAKSSDAWHAWLWQRGLYPEHSVVIQFEPWSQEAVRNARGQYGVHYVVLIGPPPFDPGLTWTRDLGQLGGLPSRVIFGELAP